MSREAFFADRRTQAAVEREFEIIGEAMTRLRREFPEVAALDSGLTGSSGRARWNVSDEERPVLPLRREGKLRHGR